METVHYDYIVVGCGGIGSGALYWLARRAGHRVLGLEQFQLGHENGGSQDYSRTIRMDYTDDAYIDLCRGAYSSWEEVEREAGLQLVYNTGGVVFTDGNPSAGQHLCDIEEAMSKHSIKCERLDGDLLRKRFPQFTTKSKCKAIYLADHGVVDSALANAVHVQLARKHGANILEGVKVTGISREGGFPLVQTTHGNYRCRRVVVTAGAWANDVLEPIGVKVPLLVTQEQVTYFATPHVKDFTKDRFPCWTHISQNGDVFYGLPIHGVPAPKVAMDAAGTVVTPQTRSFTPNQESIDKCINMCKEYIPQCLGPILMTKTCLYAMTRDRHFVIDSCHCTGFPDVIVCYGAGHAFKFASVLGKILSKLATEGGTTYDITPFTLDRKAVTDPNFQPSVKIGKWQELGQPGKSKL